MSHEPEVLIVGAGPVGLFAIFACGMMRLRCHVVDALPHVGGQCAALYPEKPIYDIPAFPSLTGQALVDQLMAQAAPFRPSFHLNQQIVQMQPDEGGWTVRGSHGESWKVKAVIIAAGGGAFGPNRPPIPGIESFEGTSVFYSILDKERFRDKRVVIAGGGDSAVDWAIHLSPIARQVFVVHRRPKFRASPESVAQLHALEKAGKITLVIPYQLSDLEGDSTKGQLARVSITTLQGEEKTLDADFLLSFFGLSSDLGPIASWGIDLDANRIVVDSSTCATSLSGVYAIGDVATYQRKRKLILTGFAEAAQAAEAIRESVFGSAPTHFEYSTTSGIPSLAG